MAVYLEYTTLTDLARRYIEIVNTSDDEFFLDCIRTASRMIDATARRTFMPRVLTRLHDTPSGRSLFLDAELLSLTTLTNGDGTVLTASDYILAPNNNLPKIEIRLRGSSGAIWQSDGNGDNDQAIRVLGVWGHPGDKLKTYADLWLTGGTLTANLTANATATTVTVAAGTLKRGQVIKVGTEFIYIDAAPSSGGGIDTLGTIVRGVNGSTAAAHTLGDAVTYFAPDKLIENLTKKAAHMLIRLRDNPSGETIVVDGVQFQTLKDVDKFIAKELESAYLIRGDF